jgi:hypothetical protein
MWTRVPFGVLATSVYGREWAGAAYRGAGVKNDTIAPYTTKLVSVWARGGADIPYIFPWRRRIAAATSRGACSSWNANVERSGYEAGAGLSRRAKGGFWSGLVWSNERRMYNQGTG